MTNKIKIILIFFILLCLLTTICIIFKNKNHSSQVLPPIKVVYISDDNYVTYLRTSIKSLFKNKNNNTQIEVFVVGVDLSEKNSKKILSENKKRLHINLINISHNLYKDLERPTAYKHVGCQADLAKFFFHHLLQDIDKIIYLDADTVVLKDLSDLYNTDLANNYVGAVNDWESTWSDNRNQKYFNNGVMLLNLKKMRQDNIGAQLIDFKRKNTNNRFVTQDVFNNVMNGKVLFLPLIYNTFATEYDDDKDVYPYKHKKDFQKAVAIIHYCGYSNHKPWRQIDFRRKSDRIWYSYAPLDFWIDFFKRK